MVTSLTDWLARIQYCVELGASSTYRYLGILWRPYRHLDPKP